VPKGSPADGDVYQWRQRGGRLLADGHPAAAATLLERAAAAEPAPRSIREALARAQYDAGRYDDAMHSVQILSGVCPTDDYAHSGPDLAHYAGAPRGVRTRQTAESA
jgi:hypothetical protein